MKTNYKKISDEDIGEISWAGLAYLFLKGKIISHTKIFFLIVFVVALFQIPALLKFENEKGFGIFHNIKTHFDNFIEHSEKTDAAETLSAISNIKTAISSKNEREGQNWMVNPETVYSEKTLNHQYILFKYLDSDRDTMYSHDLEAHENSSFVEFQDVNKNPIYVGKEKDGYLIQVQNKSAVMCKNLIFPLQDLKEVFVNLLPVDFNSISDIQKKCETSKENTIKYIFKE